MKRELLSALLLSTLAGCSGAPPAPACETTQPTTLDSIYNRYFAAQPTVASRGCSLAGCHASGAGGLTFHSAAEFYAATVNVIATQNSGQRRIEPGNPGASYLFRKISPGAPRERMPLGGPYLSDAARAEIAGWICAGAPPPGTPDGGADAP
ncbi:MAG TPA: hypothetical protein VH877_13980 [Polyangia bacterium]|jgi:hypothetical protein|nr:hypothetical protein [Polyangia bacterium]